MVGVHLVDQADLDLVSNPEIPVDRGVRRPNVTVDELPAHVLRRRAPIHLHHVVFPLDALRVLVAGRGGTALS